MRTPDSQIYIELFKELGATPVPININKMYESLKSGVVDAQTDPLTIIELFKLYEVQKYLSMTSHVWGGFNMIANPAMWQKLPQDARTVIERNVVTHVRAQRAENEALNHSLRAKLTEAWLRGAAVRGYRVLRKALDVRDRRSRLPSQNQPLYTCLYVFIRVYTCGLTSPLRDNTVFMRVKRLKAVTVFLLLAVLPLLAQQQSRIP